jgi:hypothetical protein
MIPKSSDSQEVVDLVLEQEDKLYERGLFSDFLSWVWSGVKDIGHVAETVIDGVIDGLY